MEGSKQTSQDMWNGDHVLEPSFITIRRPLESGFCVDLYLSVFVLDSQSRLVPRFLSSYFKHRLEAPVSLGLDSPETSRTFGCSVRI